MSQEPLYCLPKHPPECWKFDGGKVDVGNRVSTYTPVDHTEHGLNLRGRAKPHKAFRGLSQGPLSGTRGRSWSHFGGFNRQKLTNLQNKDFWLRFEGPCVVGRLTLHPPPLWKTFNYSSVTGTIICSNFCEPQKNSTKSKNESHVESFCYVLPRCVPRTIERHTP